MPPLQRWALHDVLRAASAPAVPIRVACTYPAARHPDHVVKNGAATGPQAEGSYQTWVASWWRVWAGRSR